MFDVKLRAINNLHEAGVDIILVTTLVNGINNDQVGTIIRFALENPKKISFIAFQPVSFTGRDELITEQRRLQQRYTLAHLAHDVQDQVGITEPTRDWFPLSADGSVRGFRGRCSRARESIGDRSAAAATRTAASARP